MEPEVLWEGKLVTGGRKGDEVSVRIVRHEGAWLDEIGQLGPGMKLQAWDAKAGEWRKCSPYEFNAVSFAIALVAAAAPQT